MNGHGDLTAHAQVSFFQGICKGVLKNGLKHDWTKLSMKWDRLINYDCPHGVFAH